MLRRARFASLAAALPVLCAAGASEPITVDILDYATLPITGAIDGKGQTDGLLARVSSLRGASHCFSIGPEVWNAALGITHTLNRAKYLFIST